MHNGQFFFHEAWNDRVFGLSPYTSNTNDRMLNKDDKILEEENADGNNAYLDLELVGHGFEDGILGYISTFLCYTFTLSNRIDGSIYSYGRRLHRIL